MLSHILLATPKPRRRRVTGSENNNIIFAPVHARDRARDRLVRVGAHGIGFTSNSKRRKSTTSRERVRVSLRSYFNRSRAGHDPRARWRRRDATGTEAPPDLLGACCLGCEPLSLSRRRVVD